MRRYGGTGSGRGREKSFGQLGGGQGFQAEKLSCFRTKNGRGLRETRQLVWNGSWLEPLREEITKHAGVQLKSGENPPKRLGES